jgi:Flp pilus assembly protein TadG
MKAIFVQKTRGQIIILFAVVLVVLLGVVALAVDTSLIYTDKRSAQNAADSAALAGGGAAAQYFENNFVTYDNFTCSDGLVVAGMNAAITGAINSATNNNSTLDADISDNNGVQVTCNVIYIGPYSDKYIDVKVAVTRTTDTSFAQLFSPDVKTETADATVRVHPRTLLAYGYALAALGTGTCASDFSGNSGISIAGLFSLTTKNGGIYSNSCIHLTGFGVIKVDPVGKDITYLTNYFHSAFFGSVTPTPTQGTNPLPGFNIPEPYCDRLANDFGDVEYKGNDVVSMEPGRYGSISLKGTVNVTMNPGLYCISKGITLTGNSELYGNGVTLYLSGGQFNNMGNGNAGEVHLTAPNTDDPAGLWIKGLLLYLPGSNAGYVALNPFVGFDCSYQGTVYAPASEVIAYGIFNGGENSQVVAKKIELIGVSGMVYDAAGGLPVFSQSATISLQE